MCSDRLIVWLASFSSGVMRGEASIHFMMSDVDVHEGKMSALSSMPLMNYVPGFGGINVQFFGNVGACQCP